MFVLEKTSGVQILSAGSALLDVLDVIAKALGHDDLDPEKAHEYLEQLMLFLKSKTGIEEAHLQALLQTLSGNPKRAVVSALEQTAWIAAKNRLSKLQGGQQWLVRPQGGGLEFLTLDDIDQNDPAVLDWKEDGATDVPAGELVFAVSGQAAAALKFEVIGDAARAQTAFGIDLASQSNSRLAVFSVEGGLGVNVNGSASGAFKLTLAGGLQASGTMRYVFQEPANTETLSLLVYALQSAANPFDIDDVAAEFEGPGVPGLRQIRFDRASTGFLDLNLNLARAVATPTIIGGPDGDVELPLNQKLDLTIKLGYRADGARTLVAERGPGNTLVLTSRFSKKSTRTAGIDLGAGIELTGLDALARQWTEHLVPDLGADLTPVVKKYAKPGDLLVGKIRKTLNGQEDWVQRLGELLLGDTTPAKLADELKRRITEELDTQVDVFDEFPESLDQLAGRAAALGNKLAARLAAENEILALFTQDLSEWIEQAIKSPLESFADDFRKQIDDAVGKVANRGKSAAEKALRPLTDFGLDINRVTDDLNTLGDKITGPIFNFLLRYGDQRAKLIKAIGEAAKAKVAISISLASKREDTLKRDWITRLQIPSGKFNDAAAADYRRWLAGRLPIDADFGGMRIGEPEGSVIAEIKGTQTANLTFDLGPMSFNYQSIIQAQVDFRVGLDGTIIAGTAGFSDDETAGGKRSAHAYFSGLIPIVSAAGVDGDPFTLGFTYTNRHKDENKRADAIEGVLNSVVRYSIDGVFDVLRGRSIETMREEVAELGDRPTRLRLSGVIPSVNFDRLIEDGLDENRLGRLMWAAYFARERDFALLRDTPELPGGVGDEGAVIIGIADFRKHRKGPSWKRELAGVIGLPSSHSNTIPVLNDAHKVHMAFNGVRSFFADCAALLGMRATLTAPVNANAAEFEQFAKEVTADAYKLAKHAADGLRHAVDPSSSARVNDEVPPDFLAFMACLDESLSGDQIVAALNLESGQGDNWELVRV